MAQAPVLAMPLETNETERAQQLAQRYRCEFVDLKHFRIQHDLFKRVPVDMMFRYNFVPLEQQDDRLVIAVSDPSRLMVIDEISGLLGQRITTRVATLTQITDLLKKTEQSQRVLDEASEGMTFDVVSAHDDSDETISIEKLTSEEDISPIIRLVDTTIFTALERRASDIHIETNDDSLVVKYRIDGVLQLAMAAIAREHHSTILSRIKVMSELDIAERRVPQDGRFRVRYKGRLIDFRVSIMPTVHGENAVLRVLDKESMSEKFRKLTLDVVGFHEDDLRRFRRYIREPYGMVLVTGPTGSGKTTTLYAALNEIKSDEDKIITIEDPVEYQLGGVNQIHVKPQIGLTFANGLRSIVRQDPDVIMVGEIRDAETAEIAVQAALTGHLVFSTLHTNDAAGAISRLLEMGVQDYLLSSSLLGVLAQRLVRRLCASCCKEVAFAGFNGNEAELPLQSVARPQTVWEGVGCDRCSGTGYLGRVGIFELLPVTSEICKVIVQRADAGMIRSLAVQQGMRLLRDDGWDKARQGITTVAEVLRVTREEA
jgi:type IV pilus assembly protein PilB